MVGYLQENQTISFQDYFHSRCLLANPSVIVLHVGELDVFLQGITEYKWEINKLFQEC